MDKTEALDKLVTAHSLHKQGDEVGSGNSEIDSAQAHYEWATTHDTPLSDEVGHVFSRLNDLLGDVPGAQEFYDRASDLCSDVQSAEEKGQWSFQDLYEACEEQHQVDAVEFAARELDVTLASV